MTDYEALYAKVKSLWEKYVDLADLYDQEALYASGAIVLVYRAKSDAFYQAIMMLREMLDE